MPGQPTTVQQQNSVSQPWQPAQPALQGILSSLRPLTGNASLNPVEQSAIGGLVQNAQGGNPYAAPIGGVATNLLSGGGATSQSPLINSAYQSYAKSLTPFTDPNNLNPYNTPGFGDALKTLNTDITNQINGEFAGAGRDLSGQNTTALARGLVQGEGSLIANQYNANANRYLGATGSEYGAGNTTSGLLSALTQQGVQNQEAGIPAASSAISANIDPFNRVLAAEAQARGIPLSYLSGLTSVAQPIAGLGGQSSGTSTTTQQVPLANQVIGGAIGGAGLLGGFGAFGPNGWLYNSGGNGGLFNGLFSSPQYSTAV